MLFNSVYSGDTYSWKVFTRQFTNCFLLSENPSWPYLVPEMAKVVKFSHVSPKEA